MSLWNRITTYLSDTQNLRKVILIFIGIIFLGGVIFFNSDIQKLLQRPWPSMAEDGDGPLGSGLNWDDTHALVNNRSNHKLIDVTIGTQKWLYALGGAEMWTNPGFVHDPDCVLPVCDPNDPDYVDDNPDNNWVVEEQESIRLISTVERLALDSDGSVQGAEWEEVSNMNFGHAEFGLVEHDGYIYVITGDIHAPKVDNLESEDQTEYPLLYSTIERLDLSGSQEDDTGSIESFNEGDPDDGIVSITSLNHGLSNLDIITISNTVNYNGRYAIKNRTDNTFEIESYWWGDAIGNWFKSRWEVFSLVSGVNFYPEVTVRNDRLHIVGGFYGNPFICAGFNKWSLGSTSGKDPMIVDDDFGTWDGLKDKPVIGEDKIPIIIKRHGLDDYVFDPIPNEGGLTDPWNGGLQQGTDLDSLDSLDHFAYDPLDKGVMIQSYYGGGSDYFKFPDWYPFEYYGDLAAWRNLALLWSRFLLNGEFYTTVSEHYIVTLPEDADTLVYRSGELGLDYKSEKGRLAEGDDAKWEVDTVLKAGHLKFIITFRWCIHEDFESFFYPAIIAPPQGRYGHKLVEHSFQDDDGLQEEMLVFGGASWSNPFFRAIWCIISGYPAECSQASIDLGFSFWVIDDDDHPLTVYKMNQITPPSGDTPEHYRDFGYWYVGHIGYKWNEPVGDPINSPIDWYGTNSSSSVYVNEGVFVSPEDRDLADSYSFQGNDSTSKGRAFFGMSELNFHDGEKELVATGGLENTEVGDRYDYSVLEMGIPPMSTFGIPVDITNRVEQFKKTTWQFDPDMSWPLNGEIEKYAYNLSSIGIDNYRSIALNGQTEFQFSDSEDLPRDDQIENIHVPDYTKTISNLTGMFDGSAWYEMPYDSEETTNLRYLSHSGVHVVRSKIDDINIVYIYKAGGSAQNAGELNCLPNVSGRVQVMGPFFYGEPGEVNPGNSTFTVEPQEVAGDGTAYAIATVALRDYDNNPIVGKHVLPFDQEFGIGSEEVRIEPFGTAEGGIGDPPIDPLDPPFTAADSYLRTSSNEGEEGMAQFKLFYNGDIEDLVYDTQIYMAYYADDPPDIPPLPEGSLGPRPLSFIKDGVPFDTFSTITAEPYKVAVDGISTSTITLTLKDGNDLPVLGYRVDVASNRNNPDIIDTIIPDENYEDPDNPGEYITDDDGIVLFSISSSTKGIARLHGAYESQSLPGAWIDLTSFALVEFAGYIAGLLPSEGVQGEDLPWMLITGAQTEWDSDLTTVSFIQPDDISFYKPLAGDNEGDVEEIRVVADGHSATAIGVRAIGHEGEDITLNIIGGDGSLRDVGSHGEEITITLDDKGKALFEYIAGTEPGIIEIGATIEEGSLWADLWLIQDQAIVHPFNLEIYADPLVLLDDPNDPISNISVRMYRLVNGEKSIIDNDLSISFDFAVDDVDDGGSMEPKNNVPVDGNGIAESTYTKGTENGKARVFVSTTYQGVYVAEKIILHKLSTFGGTLPIYPDSMTIDSSTSITLGGDTRRDPEGLEWVHIASDAKVGIWTVRVTTTTEVATPGFDNMPMIEEHPFTVLPAGYLPDPTIDIDPEQGLRGTEKMTVTIHGEGTFFFDDGLGNATEVVFEPLSGLGQEKIEILETRILGMGTPERYIEVDIKIEHDADPGWWDVITISDLGGGVIQTVRTLVDERFLVTDDDDYSVNVYSNRAEIPRDGRSQAAITVFVRELDPLTGIPTGLGSVDVTMTIDDEGTILPVDLITNDEGYAFTTYTVDTGDENGEVKITATAEPESGIFSLGWKKLSKVVYPYVGFTLKADPTAIPLKGVQTSELTAEGLPGDGIPVTFHFANSGRGYIEPFSMNTADDGTAISMYIAASEDNRIPEVVEVVAKAVVPKYGQITSNVAAIQIGLDPDKYNLTLIADPENVLAGGDVKSTVTAKLTHQYSPVANWPINFEIIQPGTGDYLTHLRVRTGSSSGEAETEFVPGNSSGMVYVRAQPLGLNLVKEVSIKKDIDPDVDLDLSTISAVPRYVPTSVDGEDFSVVTVTLRNVNYVPLPGLRVALTTDRTADVVTLDDGTLDHIAYTDYRGRAIFHVSSTQTGLSAITGTLSDGSELKTEIIFEQPGSLIWNKLKVTVPFQARDYDNEVWVYLTEDDLADPVFVNEVYLKNPNSHPEVTRNLVQELYDIKIYLHPNTTYTMWAKGRYHKARIVDTLTTGATNGSNLPVSFDELSIGDISPNRTKNINGIDYNPPVSTPYHDNYINVMDLQPIYDTWFENSYITDFLRDFVVNNFEFNYWLKNYGPGSDEGPPPFYD